MDIHITEAARERLGQSINNDQYQYIKIAYDTVGCGCVNDGVFHLILTNVPDQGDREIEGELLPFLIQEQYEVFYDKTMVIDYATKYNIFQLKSPNQMLDPRMKLTTT
ncbi:iron-sulfur cluster biosynthesis family protein [Tuberibacillus sp. Marseille-P3662]|uniref:iron-sulfur cluster biosynthesis family protein n=1 Tax=Tuberibacillus sp. Marseille-P3662 TaxID=1965358 RepID=UPI000A1C8B5A|nr:iron-sulfur cluster biosynthesis family protein [Tuberibacillus sp. Marseille-P3662]